MEDYKISQNSNYIVSIKRKVIFVLTFLSILLFCRNAFSNNISVSPDLLFIEVKSQDTAIVEVLNNQKNPLNNVRVAATSSNENIATVTPASGLTNSNGQILFTITGVSNGTATVAFNADTLLETLPVTVLPNIAPCATASSSGGGVGDFGPEKMNDNIEKDDCSYHWIRTRNEIGQKKQGWIQLDWNENVAVNKMIIQTTNCDESCGEDSEDTFYIDSGRNTGSGIVQYLDEDEITWITDGEFFEEIGDVEYLFTKTIITKAIRIKKLLPSTQCKGQQSNPIVFEWKVLGISSCK